MELDRSGVNDCVFYNCNNQILPSILKDMVLKQPLVVYDISVIYPIKIAVSIFR